MYHSAHAFKPYSVSYPAVSSFDGSTPYFTFGSRETCLAREEIWISWFVDHGCSGFVDLPQGKAYAYFIDEQSSLDLFTKFADEIEADWQQHLSRYSVKKKTLLGSSASLASSCTTGDKAEVLERFSRYCQAAYDYCEFIWSPWAVIYGLENQVFERFPDHIGVITSLDEPIEYMRMRQALHRLSSKRLAEEFGWLNVYSPLDLPFSEEDFDRLRSESKESEIREEEGKQRLNKRLFREFIDSVEKDPFSGKIEVVHKYSFMKTDRIDAWKQSMFLLRGFCSLLSGMVEGSTLADAANLSVSEITGLLAHGRHPSASELKLRTACKALYYFTPGRMEIVAVAPEIGRVRGILEKSGEKDMVKGTVACKGFARGPARLVLHSEDLKKISPGDIFIAKYTFPTFTPYMRRCGAIVTDDGGLTNHAAVVAREFGIPCVVGTKHATKTFKDGDVVEVDAERGIVRKVS